MKTGRPHMIPVGYVRPRYTQFQAARPLTNSALVVRRPTSVRTNSSLYRNMSTMGTWTYDGMTLWLRDGDLMWGSYSLTSRKVFDPSEAVPSANEWQVAKAVAAVEAGLNASLNTTDRSQVEAAVELYRRVKAVQTPSSSPPPAPAAPAPTAPAPTAPRTSGSSSSGSRPPAAPAPAPVPEKTPITQQPWFLPVVVGGSVLVIGVVVIAATGKTKQSPVPAAAN